jgi:hypothetical protein
MPENPEFLPLLSGRLAMWIREAVDSKDPTQHTRFRFPVIMRGRPDMYVEVRFVQDQVREKAPGT